MVRYVWSVKDCVEASAGRGDAPAAGAEAPKLKIGTRLGYAPEQEFYVLHDRIRALEARIAELEKILPRKKP